jgi:hypothetical protein
VERCQRHELYRVRFVDRYQSDVRHANHRCSDR